ncbi:ImmA/IrrE family metallo-endopeptidase [Enterococcus sp. ALS3]|uniref:ImmA/IrrE family metallo-endopeptidase n=1 Tax=Enterococcus alishanensis TaxID=1303817 RepID=A0ABS6TDY0_9ENTE|nr:ImmA/IrrE family metallo-endopeptidase [Enterococcus alishanensis]MBV7391091.1 ImmA/IrrE family metallo-endopeptidase [Enterococcus alishanensis]
MDFYDEDIYWEASTLAHKIVNQVNIYNNGDLKNLNVFHIKSYVEETQNAIYTTYRFKKLLSGMMAGSVQKIQGMFVISVNDSSMIERRFFSEMHETIHLFSDSFDENDGRAFSELIKEKDYLPEDYRREQIANFGAGILMANDEALVHCIHKFKKFHHCANFFFMSKKAFEVRLRTFLVFNKNLTPQYAYKVVNNYKSGNYYDLRKLL